MARDENTPPDSGFMSPEMRQLWDIIRKVVARARIDGHQARQLLANRTHFMNALAALFMHRFIAPPDFTLANELLGKDFIPPELLGDVWRLHYDSEQIAELSRTLPNRKTLEWLNANGYMLVPGPSSPMSLYDLCQLTPGYFEQDAADWHHDPNRRFMHDERVGCWWLMVRKEIVPNSTNKTWEEQQRLFYNHERAPTAVEMVWAVISYAAVRDVRLFHGVYAHTASVAWGRMRVRIGFNRDGVIVRRCSDGPGETSLGIASILKRKLRGRMTSPA